MPFLVLLVVYWRCPCAGRHLLFFVLPKKSRQKKGAEDASFPDVSLTGNGNPRSVALARETTSVRRQTVPRTVPLVTKGSSIRLRTACVAVRHRAPQL
ncbi:hypothetical protein [Paraburkholderia sp. GAS448]|uniref:hypothetical protein n=1 Tax=Paraburkholderia sp. GAS448 TaxID=3035136 RepID=UPI003D1BC489